MNRTLIVLTFFIAVVHIGFSQIESTEFDFNDFRPLDEINDPERSDSYPWISNDGLRIYYTQQLSGPTQNFIMFSEREHVDSLFSNPELMKINIDSLNHTSVWITNNELDAFFVARIGQMSNSSKLYHSSRTALEDAFGDPKPIDLLMDTSFIHLCPSLTDDMNQLLLYTSSDDGQHVLIFDKESEDAYLLVDTLDVPEGYSSGPGRFSDNGLKFYLTLTDPDSQRDIYVYERESIDMDFNSLFIIDNDEVNNSTSRNIHPMVSNNGEHFIYTSAEGNLWQNNDLAIAKNVIVSSNINLYPKEYLDITVFPNPTSSHLNFDFSKAIHTPFEILIYTNTGILVERKAFQSFVFPISLELVDYVPGPYYYRILNEEYKSAPGSFVVVQK